MMNITPVVKQLLILNIIFFIGTQLVPIADTYFALYYFENPMFKFWQPLSHMFMHANLMHIFFNMFALFSFGSALEHFWGGKKFLFFYISCGLGAALLHSAVNYFQIHYLLDTVSSLNFSKTDITVLLNSDLRNAFDDEGKMIASSVQSILEKANCSQEQFNVIANANSLSRTPAVGASGAVYGLLVAFAFMFPNAELAMMFIPIPIKAKYFVPGLLLLDLVLGFKGSSIFGSSSSGVAHFAHIGGAITGFIMMWFWKKNQFNNKRWN
jgi:membrane associated rhomboid family serine protease